MTVHAYYEVKDLTNSCNMLALRHISVLYLLNVFELKISKDALND